MKAPTTEQIPVSQLKNTRADWHGYDRYVAGKFEAGFLLDMDQEPDLREVARFNCRGVAEMTAAALNRDALTAPQKCDQGEVERLTQERDTLLRNVAAESKTNDDLACMVDDLTVRAIAAEQKVEALEKLLAGCLSRMDFGAEDSREHGDGMAYFGSYDAYQAALTGATS